MAKDISFELDQFKKGYFMAWTVATQCQNTVNVKMAAGSRQYFNKDKSNQDCRMQIIEQNNAVFEGEGKLVLTVTSNEAVIPLKSSITAGAITDQQARAVGYVYSFCIEDGYDIDYNDVYINIVAWERAG